MGVRGRGKRAGGGVLRISTGREDRRILGEGFFDFGIFCRKLLASIFSVA